MSVSISEVRRTVFGNRRVVVANVTFDSSYPTGGEALAPSALSMQNFDLVQAGQASGYAFEYDYTNQKLKAYLPVGAVAAHGHGPGSLADAASAVGSSHTHAATTKDIYLTHSGGEVKGSANTDAENADAAAAPTNSASVSADATVAAGAWTKGALTNPDRGRNVCIVIENPTGGPLGLYEGAMTFTVTGTYRGGAQVDTIVITSTAGNKSVATTKFRYKYGVKPFDTVTDITLANVPANGLVISAGLGSKIGLPTTLATPAEADVVKITKNAADLSPSGIVDTTNSTVNLGALTDNDDFEIIYKAVAAMTAIAAEAAHTHAVALDTGTSADGGAISATAAAEVANTTNLSAVTVRCVFTGE